MLDNIHVSRVGLWDTAKKNYVDIFSERLTDSLILQFLTSQLENVTTTWFK